jgi:DNA-directed RNA polymerase subunit delta
MAKKVAKKRIVKDYDKLPKEIVTQVKLEYPNGFAHKLIMYTTPKGEKVSALPFESSDIYYLIRMTVQEARQIIRDDEDYDDEGKLREDFNLDELDLDGLAKEEEISPADDDDDEDYIRVRQRRRRDEDDDDGDDDY